MRNANEGTRIFRWRVRLALNCPDHRRTELDVFAEDAQEAASAAASLATLLGNGDVAPADWVVEDIALV